MKRWINRELPKIGDVLRRLEHRTAQDRLEIHFAGRTIAEPKPNDEPRDIARFQYVVVHPCTSSLERLNAEQRLAGAGSLPVFQ